MEIYFIVAGCIICLLIITVCLINFLSTRTRKKNIYSRMMEISEKEGYTFTEHIKQIADYSLENADTILYFKTIAAPSNSIITANSKETWSLQWGGGSTSPGKIYPNKRYLNELVPFFKKEFDSSKNIIKVILIYKTCHKVMKYLNESELAIVDIKDYAWGTKVIRYKELDRFLELI